MVSIGSTTKKCMRTGKKLPSVTIVVPTCGVFSRLEKTLFSIADQAFPIETVVVSDDGSGQDFPRGLRDQFVDVVFRQNEYNLGTVAHMNTVARTVGSKYIKFLAAGDAFSDPEALGALVTFAEEVGTLVVTSQAMVCDETLKRKFYMFPGRRGKVLWEPGKAAFRRLAVSNIVSAPGTLFHQTFFAEPSGFDESYRLLEDWPAWLRLTREGGSIPLLNRVTCLYGTGGISSEALDAYCSSRLRKDMILCYEKEILPYLGQLNAEEARQVQFGYDQLCGLSATELRKKYGWLECRTALKRSVKKCLLKSSRIFR